MRANTGCRRRTSQSPSITFPFRVVEFALSARSGTNRVHNTVAKRPAAVSHRTEGSPHTPALCPATSTPAMNAAEPMPRTQPYSKAPALPPVVDRDQESASASASGARGASIAAWVRVTKASSQKLCVGKYSSDVTVLQTELALVGKRRTHPRAGQQTAQKEVSPQFRRRAETRAIRTLFPGRLGMPAGMATRIRNCNSECHKGGETEATNRVELTYRFSKVPQISATTY